MQSLDFFKTGSPTASGLLYMVIAGGLVLIGTFACFVLVIVGWILAVIGFFSNLW